MGSNGTPHLQGFVTFKAMQRFLAMKKINKRAHWEVAKSISRINREHCLKGSQPKAEWGEFDTSGLNHGVDVDPFEKGKCPAQGQRLDLEATCDRIDEGASMKDVTKEFCTTFVNNFKGLNAHQLITMKGCHSNTTHGIWIWGPSGAGNSSKVWKDCSDSLFDKAQNKWFDGCTGEETTESFLTTLTRKVWTDHCPHTGETKGGTVHAPPAQTPDHHQSAQL